mgnify:CR=1 FL=1
MCLVISNTNLSLVPFEVMACNSVAVCSKGANSSWMVNEENSILVDYDPIQIADRMEYYFNHPDELATIRKKGMDFVKGTSWYKEAEKVYASMLKELRKMRKNCSKDVSREHRIEILLYSAYPVYFCGPVRQRYNFSSDESMRYQIPQFIMNMGASAGDEPLSSE